MAIADGFHVDINGNLWLGSDRETFDATTRSEAPFYVYANGNMVANSGTFAGTLSSGISISAPVITGGSISGTTGDFSGDISGASGTFTGDLSGADISGGTIDIGSGTFEVDSSGNLTATSATITGSISSTSGTIGGWTIGSTDLSSGNISIDSTGSISGNYSASTGWRIQSDGSADFNNVNVRGDLLGVELKGDLDFNGGRLRTSTSGTRIEITDNNNLEGEIDFITTSGYTGKISAASGTQFLIENGVLSGEIKLALGSAQDEIEFQATRINFSDPLGFNPIIEINGGTNTNKVLGVNSSGRLEFQSGGASPYYTSGIQINGLQMQDGYNFDIVGSGDITVTTTSSPYRATISHDDSQHSFPTLGPSGGNYGSSGNAARLDHGHIGTGISQINSPSTGLFSGYTFNSSTGAFSVSTITNHDASYSFRNVYPTSGTSSDLGNNFGNGRWRRLYTLNSPSVSSDERLKENIIDIPYGLDYINSLEPKQYNLKRVIVRGCNTCEMEIDEGIDECWNCIENGDTADIVDNLDVTGEKSGVVNFGFTAQDLISTPPEPDVDIALVDYDEDSDEYGVRYNELIAPLVKAVQELSAKNDELQLRIEALEG